jgi:hypothetical protein
MRDFFSKENGKNEKRTDTDQRKRIFSYFISTYRWLVFVVSIGFGEINFLIQTVFKEKNCRIYSPKSGNFFYYKKINGLFSSINLCFSANL